MILRLALALAATQLAVAQPPSAADRQAMVSRMREAALNYGNRLQDFTCLQHITRSIGRSDTAARFKLLETQERNLIYVAHQEHFKLVSVNGQTTNLEKRIKQGYYKAGGEFGGVFRWIFQPKANTSFEWNRSEESAGKRYCVFQYHAPRETSTLVMQVNLNYVPLGHQGTVYADCDTGQISRIQLETEPQKTVTNGHEIAVGLKLEVRYGPVTIASKEYLLPLEATEISTFHTTLTKVEIRFQDYRKYDADSSITFDDADPKPAVPGKR